MFLHQSKENSLLVFPGRELCVNQWRRWQSGVLPQVLPDTMLTILTLKNRTCYVRITSCDITKYQINISKPPWIYVPKARSQREWKREWKYTPSMSYLFFFFKGWRNFVETLMRVKLRVHKFTPAATSQAVKSQAQRIARYAKCRICSSLLGLAEKSGDNIGSNAAILIICVTFMTISHRIGLFVPCWFQAGLKRTLFHFAKMPDFREILLRFLFSQNHHNIVTKMVPLSLVADKFCFFVRILGRSQHFLFFVCFCKKFSRKLFGVNKIFISTLSTSNYCTPWFYY
jgi:hypothetical protein